MKKASPAPIATPISKTDNMNLPWQTWARESSDFLVSATKSLDSNSVNYTVIGQICFISINASFENGKIQLPYTALVSKKIQLFADNAETPTYSTITSGSKELTVTANVNIMISDWFVIKLDS